MVVSEESTKSDIDERQEQKEPDNKIPEAEDKRLPWETPKLSRLNARKAEHGLLLGPEVLVLLRS
jgi:hypothetical protein